MTDILQRLHHLSPQKRLLLERLLKQKAATAVAPGWQQSLDPAVFSDPYDVAILGGGLAGSSLAIQLQKACPEARIVVAEQQAFPLPEAAHKVGESTVEVGARYFSDVIGMRRHLQTDQLLKLGLRFFFPADDNRDLARRVEVGAFASKSLPLPSYQIDRGRFENALALEARKLGVFFLDACKVRTVDLGTPYHQLTLVRDANAHTVSARWLIDASGRTGFLKRRLGLAQRTPHHTNAVWFRLGERINVEDWSHDPAWRQRIYPGFRQLSTNHLMGPGYWVWLIPLASGATSVGIVADATLHPFERLNRFDRALDWLRAHEPQCAEVIAQKQERLLDFRTQKHYAHGCRQVMSTERWCLTGEAGVFTDPFYSPGSDFIAISNTLITRLIQRDLANNNIDQHVALFNWFYLDFMFAFTLDVFSQHYPGFGNIQMMTVKIVWDFSVYWGVIGLLFFHDVLGDFDFMTSIKPDLLRLQALQARTQTLFRNWCQRDQAHVWRDTRVDFTQIDFLYHFLNRMQARLGHEPLKAQLSANIQLLETVSAEIARRAFDRTPTASDTLSCDGGRATPGIDLSADFQKFWLNAPVAIPGCV